MNKNYLLAPGPTTVPSEVLLKMAEPIIHHRTPEFSAVIKEVSEGMQHLFQTTCDVYPFAASGTGAMESAIANILSPGDKAITVIGGKFGQRWQELVTAYGAEAITIDMEWGNPVDPATIQKLLADNPDVKAVYTTLCETSTCVVSNIKAIGEVVAKTSAVLVVDVVSGLGAVEFKMDDWKVDIAVVGSQKGLMLPPGLAFAAVSAKAFALVEKSTSPKYYLSYPKAKKAFAKNDTAFTPAVTLFKGLAVAINMIKEEGIENTWSRHALLAKATRAAAKAMGLSLFNQGEGDNVATAVLIPDSIGAAAVKKHIFAKYGFTIAGGQEHLKGKIIRIAHLGYADKFDMISVIAALEMTLKDLGYDIKLGTGVGAAMQVLGS